MTAVPGVTGLVMSSFALDDIRATDARGQPIDRMLTEREVRQSVTAILEANVLFSLATVTPDGRAHASTAYFSYSNDLRLYFLSHPGSQHCLNLARNPSAAVTIFSSQQQWTDPGQGLQVYGTCETATGSAEEDAERVYATRFPAYRAWKTALTSEDLARQYRFYRFDAMSIKVLDERNLGDAVFVGASVRRG